MAGPLISQSTVRSSTTAVCEGLHEVHAPNELIRQSTTKTAMQQSAADGDRKHTARAFVLTIRHVSSVATQATQLNQPRSEHVLIQALKL